MGDGGGVWGPGGWGIGRGRGETMLVLQDDAQQREVQGGQARLLGLEQYNNLNENLNNDVNENLNNNPLKTKTTIKLN